MKPNRLAVYGLTAGLLSGGAAGLALTGSTLASAQVSDVTGTVNDPAATTDSTAPGGSTAGSGTSDSDSSTTSTESPAATSSEPGTPSVAPAPAPATAKAKPVKGEWAKSVLDGLVVKGTITQAQADEILAALDSARPARGPGKGVGRGHGHAKLDAAAQALRMSAEDLRLALESGKSLAAVAQEKGIAVSQVVDALVAAFKAHLDREVAAGIHTQAEADQKLADARARLEAFVNGTAPAGKPGGFGGRRHGGGPGSTGPAPAGGSNSGTTTS